MEFQMDPTIEFNLPRTLDTFTRAYIEALYWTDDIPEDAELAPSALASIITDCADFQESNADLLADMDASSAGHDFWLTRNRHGAGFWDRGLGEDGKLLTDAAHAYGSQDVYLGDDGLLYV
jgi:hypothetical protein